MQYANLKLNKLENKLNHVLSYYSARNQHRSEFIVKTWNRYYEIVEKMSIN